MAVSPEDFAAKHWGRSPLLSIGEQLPSDFSDLFGLDVVDELLSRRGLRTPFIRLAKNGVIVDAGRFTGRGGVGAQVKDQVLDERVLELFADGHTIVLQGLHRLWPPLIEFAGALGADLGHPVQVNAYITPKSSAGFSAHYDVHDVFVLQIAGEKRWRVHDPVLVDPLPDQPWEQHRAPVRERAQEPPTIDSVLRPGDALYLPRGYLHAAEALKTVSVHLTVGAHPVTRYDLVEALLRLLADDPQVRASLPLGFDPSDPDALAPDLAATVEALRRRVHPLPASEIARRLAERILASSRPAPLAPIAQAAALDSVSGETVLALRKHLRVALIEQADDVEVTFAGRRLLLPAHDKPALSTLLAESVVRVDQLPGLDLDDAIALARQLLREGFVVPVSSDVPRPRA